MLFQSARKVKCCKCGEVHINGAGLRRHKERGRYAGLICGKCLRRVKKSPLLSLLGNYAQHGCAVERSVFNEI